jgi:integrase
MESGYEMAKERTGFVVKRDGKFYARISYTDANGKRRELMRKAEDKPAAKKLLKELTKQLDQPDTARQQRIEGDKLTFAQLADQYQEARIIPPQYQGDKKIAGLRSWKHLLSLLKALRNHFGKKRVREITVADLEAFKRALLKTPTRYGRERSIANVNRELALLRAMLNYAKRQGWIQLNPFENGDDLVSQAHENKRDKILSAFEEEKLLAVCVDKRTHLRPLIIAALDTGCRRGELFSLKWSDVDLAARVIRLRAFTTKTAKSREVPITHRLAIELERLKSDVSDDTLVFTCGDVKRSFATACRLAGIEGLHFHGTGCKFYPSQNSLRLMSVKAISLKPR